MDIMRSVVGMVILLAIAFLLSVNKKRISLRTVGAALVLQIAIGGIMLYFPPGKWLVEQAALGVHKVMSYSDAGSAFIFGSWLGQKWMCCLTGLGLSSPSGCSRPSFCDRTHQSALLHWRDGAIDPHPRRYFPEGVEHQ